jgi:hypothetical protein
VNRRHFFSALGAAVAIAEAEPITMAKPVITVSGVDYLPMDVINAVAFAIHGEAFPEHREHYRTKAMNILARRALDLKDRKERGL